MKALKTLVASTLIAVAAPSMAGVVKQTLDFETVPVTRNNLKTEVNPYQAQNITFSDGAFSLGSVVEYGEASGATGNFFREASVYGSITKGALAMLRAPNDPISGLPSIYINVADGFDTAFSMLYTSLANVSGTVQIFSGANGEGQELVSGVLGPMSGVCTLEDGTPGPSGVLCNWTKLQLGFTGSAHSIKITGANASYYFDDIALTRTSGSNVPEPASIALSLAALGALALSRKRKQQA